MSLNKLKAALSDCVINFDSRVLVTDLLQDYELKYSEVNAALEEFLREQERSGTKYEKRFLVHGEEKEGSKEVYTVVEGETKRKEWLSRLKNAETALYSVEVAGGAKAAAESLKPLYRPQIRIKNMVTRVLGKVGAPVNGHANGADSKAPTKTEIKGLGVKGEKTAAAATSTKIVPSSSSKPATAFGTKAATPEAKKTPIETTKKSPEEQKATTAAKTPTQDIKNEPKKSAVKKPVAKKGINNFFAPAAATSQATGKKDKTVSASPSGAKKMNDFFKKQPEKTPSKEAEKTKAADVPAVKANTSVQLFEPEVTVDVDMEEHDESSDEEAHLEKLKRDIISSDHEDADEAETPPTTSSAKRRRIIDSDEEEEAPQQKHEKIEEKVEEEVKQEKEEEAPANQSETFLDEEGFVITVKSKQRRAKTPPKPVAKVSPPSSKKSPKKAAPKSKAAATAPANSKTKQANIMNFFAKK